MAVNKVDFKLNNQTETTRQPSPALWADCPVLEILENPGRGYHYFDDFLDFGLPGTQTTELNLGRYKVYNTGATKITSVSAINSVEFGGGAIALTLDTAGDAAAIGTQTNPFLLSTTIGGKLWFEARIATLSIATNDGQLFVGLGETDAVTFGAATPLADADATASGLSMIGFNRLEDGLGVLNTVTNDRAAVWTNIQAAAGAIAANTWVKVGFLFDPADSARCVRFFVDNLETTTPMTKAALLATTNLDANGLGLVAAAFADSGAAAVLYLDWWRCAQLVP